jgi:hypothetical protein
MARSMQANAPAACQHVHTLDYRKEVEMEPAAREPAPAFPMTARTALLDLLRTHDGAVDGDPRGVLGTAERHLRAHPDDVEVRDACEELRARTRGMPGARPGA